MRQEMLSIMPDLQIWLQGLWGNITTLLSRDVSICKSLRCSDVFLNKSVGRKVQDKN